MIVSHYLTENHFIHDFEINLGNKYQLLILLSKTKCVVPKVIFVYENHKRNANFGNRISLVTHIQNIRTVSKEQPKTHACYGALSLTVLDF